MNSVNCELVAYLINTLGIAAVVNVVMDVDLYYTFETTPEGQVFNLVHEQSHEVIING